MNRETALKAVDDAFDEGVKHLYSVFVQGLTAGEAAAVLAERFAKGLALQCDAHARTALLVTDHFK